MNIGYMKLGKRLKVFSEHGIANGDFDYSTLLKLLSKEYPQNNYFVIGPNDLRKNSFENVKIYDEKISLNGIIALMGPCDYLSNEELEIQLKVLNSGVPWVEINHDVRFGSIYFKGLKTNPEVSLGQGHYYMKNKDKVREVIYAHQEKLSMYGKRWKPFNGVKLKDLVVIVAPSLYRQLELDKYLHQTPLNGFQIDVYGPKEIKSSYWRGPISLENYSRILPQYRFGLCIPVSPGPATSKYLEYLVNGVVPLIHPDYDVNYNTNYTLGRLSNPNDLISFLNLDESISNHYLSKCEKYLTPDMFDGTLVGNIILKALL
jgi:hypothetical protein